MHKGSEQLISPEARNLLISQIENSSIDLPKGGKRDYRRLLVTAEDMCNYGLTVNPAYTSVVTLVVPGTSISFSETGEYLAWLLDQGYPVASIENPIGTLFEAGINPKLERPLILEHFLDHLQNQGPAKVKQVIGFFQSYAAFDVIRLITKNSHKFKLFMPVFFLDNPAGFNGPMDIMAHIFRWLFIHMFGGLLKQVLHRFWDSAYPIPLGDAARDDYRKRELRDLSAWWKNTLKNPVRGGIREVYDICRFNALGDMQKILEAGYKVGMFKHSGDKILPIGQTIKHAKHLFSDNLIILDGGHNDLFAQKKNRSQIADRMYKNH